jgi:hypothetical protein
MPSGVQRRVVLSNADVSEKHRASTFSIEVQFGEEQSGSRRIFQLTMEAKCSTKTKPASELLGSVSQKTVAS